MWDKNTTNFKISLNIMSCLNAVLIRIIRAPNKLLLSLHVLSGRLAKRINLITFWERNVELLFMPQRLLLVWSV